MKYKLFGGAMALVMLLCALAATALETKTGTARYHQHLSAALPAEECTCEGTELCTHLPIIRIDTGGQYIPGEIIRDPENEEIVLGYTTAADGAEDILITIETVEGEGLWHHASDEADQSSLARFRIRGNSSRNFHKKSYRVKLVADETGLKNEELPLLGMNPDNDWALHGPFLDKTLLRNYMWMNISAEIMGYAPNVRFCEVLLDGEYQGVYLLMETIKEDEYRVDLSDFEAGAGSYSYLLETDGMTQDDILSSGGTEAVAESYTLYTHQMEFDEMSTTMFCIRYPQAEVLTEDVLDYIQRDISRVERGLYSSDMVTGRYDYARELNVDSFVDYYILQEFLAVNDAFSRSTFLYRDIRGKLNIGPVWDYN
ncbi:MAG: CotH kinase family protein, partial [Butyricicoccus sp.]|nr:CotH kinase family protein [Butyricicoccus sp.]